MMTEADVCRLLAAADGYYDETRSNMAWHDLRAVVQSIIDRHVREALAAVSAKQGPLDRIDIGLEVLARNAADADEGKK